MTGNLRDRPTLGKLLRNWRTKLSAVVIAFNIEIVVIPWILIWIFKLSGPVLRNTTGIWATVEMSWWIYYSSWAPNEAAKIKSVAEVIELGEEVGPEFVSEVQETDAVKKIIEFVDDHTVGKFDIEHWKNSGPYVYTMAVLKVFGYTFGWLFILFVSAIPFPGIWIPGLAVCRKQGWKFGYVALFIGNFIKSYFYAYVWEMLWPYRFYMFGGLFLIVVLVYAYKKHKGLTWKDMLLNTLTYFSRTDKNRRDTINL